VSTLGAHAVYLSGEFRVSAEPLSEREIGCIAHAPRSSAFDPLNDPAWRFSFFWPLAAGSCSGKTHSRDDLNDAPIHQRTSS
jgi:hypothetical protein